MESQPPKDGAADDAKKRGREDEDEKGETKRPAPTIETRSLVGTRGSSMRTSPLSSTLGRGSLRAADDPPFSLFAASFETLSDADHYSLSMDHSLSPGIHHRSKHPPNHGIDIALPDLKHPPMAGHESDISMGDISPIKLSWANNNGPPVEPRRSIDDLLSGYHSLEATASWKFQHRFEYGTSNPFFVIRSSKKAFAGCKYQLPCLSGDDVCQVNVSEHGQIHHYRGPEATVAILIDVKIATRRVETAVCAFGGTLHHPDSKSDTSSIFRLRGDAKEKQLYQRRLPSRYYMSGAAISWEVEENPPISIESKSAKDGASSSNTSVADSHEGRRHSGPSDRSTSSAQTASKMKYRCKLCGQPKQNHDCPYRQSMHRSIGVMVFPSVNAYTAAEPGAVAPALTKMNNFVSYDSDQGSPKPGYPSAFLAAKHRQAILHPTTVTPGTFRTGNLYNSPQSSLSNHSSEDGPVHSIEIKHQAVERVDPHPLFAAAVSLRPEHYRAVTSSKEDEESTTAYHYPPIPLTFAERKRLSDTLFHLSKEIPNMTADCASILREARKNNEWDQAVAELLTQIVVGLYCGEGDTCLDGLQQYLLSLGIAC